MAERFINVRLSKRTGQIEAVVDRGLKSGRFDFVPVSANEALALIASTASALQELVTSEAIKAANEREQGGERL